MIDNTTGDTQDVAERVVASAAGTFDGNNDGSGSVAAVAEHGEQCPLGEWRFTCVGGLGTGEGGSERFDFVYKSSEDDTTFTGSGLVVNKRWEGPLGFGPIKVTRTYTFDKDDADDFGSSAGFNADGANEGNTDRGILYYKLTANGSNFDYAFYKNSSRREDDLVAEGIDLAVSSSGLIAQPRNGSGLTVTFSNGATPSANASPTTSTIDCNFFSVRNSSDVADKFAVTTTLTSSGVTQNLFRVLFGYYMNSITSGSEEFDDDILTRPGTFYPRGVIDI
jgi:hypothetical protein